MQQLQPRSQDQQIQLQDINTIIKYFTIQIYQRMMELQQKNRLTIKTNYENFRQQEVDLSEDVDKIVNKYNAYITNVEIEIEYVRKMVQRLLQIFGFYKWKCRNQSILNHVERQITNKLNLLLNENCINIGKIISFIVDICRKGFIHKHNPTPTYNNFTSAFKQRGRLMSKSQTCKNNNNNQNKKQQEIKINKEIKPGTIQSNHFNSSTMSNLKRRRTTSVMCQTTSAFNCKGSANANPNTDTNTNGNNSIVIGQVIDKLYSCMNIDKPYMIKAIQSQSCLAKDQFKRNRSTFKKLQAVDLPKQKNSIFSSTRKIRTQPNQSQYRMALKQFGNNEKLNFKFAITSAFEQQKQLKKAPLMNLSAWNRKRCKVKTTCLKKNKQKKVLNNQNNFV